LVDEIRLSLIDESNRDDHSRLTANDSCYYLFEYTSHRGYSFSSTNQLIAACGRHLGAALNPNWLNEATLVPVPGSKAQGHPDHDNRIERICRAMRQPSPDVRALVVQTESTTASHEAGDGERVTVEELLAVYQINEALAAPVPRSIAIVDDVLTAGTHYRAMHIVLSARFPIVPIIGLFIARRVFPDDDFGFDDL
jgi:predicted amidophosphoribosyltransferase